MTDFVPNPERAVVDGRKIYGYLLSSVHAVGRHKAEFFKALGYDLEQWSKLQTDLQAQARSDVAAVTETEFGTKYEVRSELTGPNGRSARIVTIWMLSFNGEPARLVTAYPEE